MKIGNTSTNFLIQNGIRALIDIPLYLWYNVAMQNNIENNSAMQKSDDLLGSSDSLIGNGDSPSLEQYNSKTKHHKEQVKSHEKIDTQEHQKAETDLINDIANLNLDKQIITEDNIESFLHENFPKNEKAKNIAEEYLAKRNSIGLNVSSQKLSQIILNNIETKE